MMFLSFRVERIFNFASILLLKMLLCHDELELIQAHVRLRAAAARGFKVRLVPMYRDWFYSGYY